MAAIDSEQVFCIAHISTRLLHMRMTQLLATIAIAAITSTGSLLLTAGECDTTGYDYHQQTVYVTQDLRHGQVAYAPTPVTAPATSPSTCEQCVAPERITIWTRVVDLWQDLQAAVRSI